jgi:hypothetical protein
VRAAVKDQWKYLKEYASRQLWLATIAAEVEKEKESNNKKAEEKAI